MLTLVPIAMIFSKAPLDTMKAATVITAVPFIAIIMVQTYGLVKWLQQDYGHIPAHKIDEANMAEWERLQADEQAAATPVVSELSPVKATSNGEPS